MRQSTFGISAGKADVLMADADQTSPSEVPGLFKAPGHFYSPIGDPPELRRYWASEHKSRQSARVDALLDYAAMSRVWGDIAAKIVAFPMTRTEGFRYYGINNQFMYYDASILSGMIQTLNPKKIIEIGAGYSSAAMFDTVDRMKSPNLRQFTTIDPDMKRINRLSPPAMSQLVQAPVQSIPIETFVALEPGDLFFIDSSHVLKTGSDVHYEYLHIIPALKPGVIIHIHDVFYPFEYPRRWVLDENRSWNEIYLVDMMLSHSDRYEVLFFNDAMLQNCSNVMRQQDDMFARFEAVETKMAHRNNGSIWLRKR
jgi:predicted O-methyltransferase YrrM